MDRTQRWAAIEAGISYRQVVFGFSDPPLSEGSRGCWRSYRFTDFGKSARVRTITKSLILTMPLKENGWKGDLDPFLERISAVATGSGSLSIFNSHIRVALGLPADRTAALVVAGLYHPQKWKGRMLKILTELSITTNIRLGLSSFHGGNQGDPEIGWLREAAKAGSVGFLGCNPAHGPRCILGGILPETQSRFVAKLGFDESSGSIKREARFLESVKGKYAGVILPIDYNQGSDWRLLRLPYLGEIGPQNMQDGRVVGLLDAWLGDEWVTSGELPWARHLLDKVPTTGVALGWHERMGNHRVLRALIHGDFAVWNLRLVNDGICALDWEWAEESGISGIDLAHGLRQECYMVKAMSPAEAVKAILKRATQDPWRTHLERCGWASHLEDWLTLGLLHSHFNARNDSAGMLETLGIRLGTGGIIP